MFFISVDPCDSGEEHCSGNGKCVSHNDGTFHCECNQGWSGEACDDGEYLLFSALQYILYTNTHSPKSASKIYLRVMTFDELGQYLVDNSVGSWSSLRVKYR